MNCPLMRFMAQAMYIATYEIVITLCEQLIIKSRFGTLDVSAYAEGITRK
jgi:hypothetical protein